MPAMWDTFKTGNGPSLHQQPPQELKNRPFLRQNRSSSSGLPQSRSTSSAHSNQTANSNKSRDDITKAKPIFTTSSKTDSTDLAFKTVLSDTRFAVARQSEHQTSRVHHVFPLSSDLTISE
ncbi:hypothetical protein NXS19_001221 [Fusarium pseudograminearum]|nr:hypothetical protein NXS19_001221 [Fusarium pseudograminearum]